MEERILNWLREYDSNMLDAWKAYCDDNCYYDDEIYVMDELNDYMYGCSVIEIIDRCSDVNTSDDYFKDGIYGLESFNNLEDAIDIDALIEWIVENDNDCYSNELREILDDDYDDDEDVPKGYKM